MGQHSFYARRALRIFPLYYLVLTATLLITHFTPALNYVLSMPHDRIFYFVYLSGRSYATPGTPTSSATSGVWREWIRFLPAHFLPSAVRRPELLKRIQKYVYALGITSALLALAIFYGRTNEGLMDTLGLTLLALAFGALVLRAFVTDGSSNSRLQRFLSNRQLMTAGTYSYGMYVYHVPILHFSHALVRRFFPLETVCGAPVF